MRQDERGEGDETMNAIVVDPMTPMVRCPDADDPMTR